jgi:WS/DGAT/MGAT family acyltransferase
VLVDSARSLAFDAVSVLGRVTGAAGGLAAAVRTLARPAPRCPLNVEVSGGRVFAGVRTELAEYREIREVQGGTVNDVVLAAITGALREWLLSRDVALTDEVTVRALVPLAVTDASTMAYSPAGIVGNEVVPHLVDLPVGEADPVVRLQHVSHGMREHRDTGRWVAARSLARLGGFAPPTLHSLGARAAATLSNRIFNLVITNSPGPQVPMYAASARMTEMFPIVPLVRQHALAIGVTSYDGGVYIGLNGDRKAVHDIDAFATMVEESLDELKDSIR